jgi:flagellar hook protein FlgE
MFKSLYSGVSGMSANMTELDVIGNNIANSNTVGFKTGRVTFNEMLTQTIRGASRPVSGGVGGTNPQQIGLGVRVGGIDSNFSQGNFQTTGLKTDLAIQGPGFFILSDGTSNSYTRAGVFGLDADNFFVNPATGLRLQGVMADDDGNVATGPLEDLFLDPGMVVPATASSEVQLIGNLNADSDAAGTVRQSPTLLAAAEGDDRLVDLSGQRDGSLNLDPGNTVTLTRSIAGGNAVTDTYTISSTADYQDLVDWLNSVGAGLTFSIGAGGELAVANGTGSDVTNLGLTVPGKTVFNQNFAFPDLVAAGGNATTINSANGTGMLRGHAEASDTIAGLFNSLGTALGLDLSSGSTSLVIAGAVGGDAVPNTVMTVDATTTLADLMAQIQTGLALNSSPVELNELGQIVVRGEVGSASALSRLQISEQDTDNNTLETAFLFRETAQARDQQDYSVSTTIYDSLGGQHTVTFSFEKVPGMNEWIWQAEMEGEEEILAGGSGRMRFAENGGIANFTYDDASGALTFRPQPEGEEGAEPVTVQIDYGDAGGLNGLTQFEGNGRLQSIADGFTTGQIVDYEIDQTGMVVGRFSNDTMRNIGRVSIAQFSNSAGLMREANNTYSRSGNSGDALTTFAGEGNGLSLAPGALESSNVDLAREFTRLVVAQRAFQANSRVVTTGDTLMQELVNLVR